MLQNYVSILRVRRYSQNLIIFLGFLIALLVFNVFASSPLIAQAILLFIIYCLISSGNYILNDIVDRSHDKKHPEKKSRLITHGIVKLRNASLIMLFLWLFGLWLGILFFDTIMLIMLLVFIFSGFMYNVKPMRTKDIVFLDVFSEAVNNPLRLIAGWYIVTSTLPSIAVILFFWFYACIPMSAKRLAELRFLGKEKAGEYRVVFQRYTEKNLKNSIIIYTIFSTTMLVWISISSNLLFLAVAALLIIQIYWYFLITLKDNSIVQKPFKIYQERDFTLFSLIIVALALLLIVL